MTAAAAVPIRETSAKKPSFDVEGIREDFPILRTKVHGHPLVYLDNAATSQKPQAVIDALVRYYEGQNANIHRGVHYLSQIATEAFEEARETVRAFVNAAQTSEIAIMAGHVVRSERAQPWNRNPRNMISSPAGATTTKVNQSSGRAPDVRALR